MRRRPRHPVPPASAPGTREGLPQHPLSSAVVRTSPVSCQAEGTNPRSHLHVQMKNNSSGSVKLSAGAAI